MAQSKRQIFIFWCWFWFWLMFLFRFVFVSIFGLNNGFCFDFFMWFSYCRLFGKSMVHISVQMLLLVPMLLPVRYRSLVLLVSVLLLLWWLGLVCVSAIAFMLFLFFMCVFCFIDDWSCFSYGIFFSIYFFMPVLVSQFQ